MIIRRDLQVWQWAGGMGLIGLICLLAACAPAPSEPVPTVLPLPTHTTWKVSPTPRPTPLHPISLMTDTAPYDNRASLLNDVCFAYLATQTKEGWKWTTDADLSAFFARVNASELCSNPVPTPEFDFTEYVLVGAVKSAEGCDAAHRILDTLQDETAGPITVHVELVIQTGCPYELIEPLLIAVPRDWATVPVYMEWTTTTIAP